ncbi:MAG: type III-A CRISPR-associated RAMP protein Csm3 [Paludibacteraceae bacterium]|nr:type III-A CRISPR-associated RAMP protein Csm3 [Paludibacteraceae bacterium]
MKKLAKKIKLNTSITLITGLHIGGSGDNVEIGGIDNPVIKLGTRDNQPYIPGSSLKGKIRCLLEQIEGSAKVGGNDNINNLFGYSQTNQPSKLIVRDAMLTPESAERLRNCENLDMPYTEGKWENVIDRVKGTAEHPRQTERIPASVSFDVEFVINVWDDDKEDELLNLLKKGINALENDYLGGSGSRGYGQIKFENWTSFEASEETNWTMSSK